MKTSSPQLKIEDFEPWFQEFKNIHSSQWYLGDLIFHAVATASSRCGRRFALGIVSWVCWAFYQCLKKSPETHFSTQRMPLGAYLLSTQAHEATLLPLVQQFREENLTIVNCSPDYFDGLKNLEISLNFLPTRAMKFLFVIFQQMRRATLAADKVEPRVAAAFQHARSAILDSLWNFFSIGTPSMQVKTLLLTYELSAASKAWCKYLRTQGSRIIHIMHGQRLPTYQVTMATDLVLFSKIDEPWFRARVDPSIRIWTIGHPRLEDVRKKVGPAQASGNRRPRIAFFSQPVEGDYSREPRIADWKICATLRGRAEVRFRAHPRENREQIPADMLEAGIEFAEISEAGLIDDLAWCDAVASSWSTVSMEAAACGRGIFWTCNTPERYEASQELRDHGIGVLLNNPGHWDEYLDQWMQGGWTVPVVVPEARLRELGMIGDMHKTWVERLEIEVAMASPKIEDGR